ncbi:uncharacterized protein TNCV_4261431 [Trichonephila clavipes]|nr:uncharacterized protein TNCV_4261431 [Trichonephila clavipes]
MWRWPGKWPTTKSGICCREAYGGYIRCDSLGSDLGEQTITSNRPSIHFEGTQLRRRDFNASCTAYIIKASRDHLSERQRSFIHCTTLPTIS